jgi:hypothetical protein
MLDFLKTMGQGILYFILSPFLLLLILGYSIYSFILFFIMFVKRIIKWFKGEDMSIDMSIDKVAQIHIEEQDKAQEEKENTPVVNETKTIIHEQNNTVFQPIFIQTDEEGRVKGFSYMNNNGANPNQSSNPQSNTHEDNVVKEETPTPPQLEEIPLPDINSQQTKEEEEHE